MHMGGSQRRRRQLLVAAGQKARSDEQDGVARLEQIRRDALSLAARLEELQMLLENPLDTSPEVMVFHWDHCRALGRVLTEEMNRDLPAPNPVSWWTPTQPR